MAIQIETQGKPSVGETKFLRLDPTSNDRLPIDPVSIEFTLTGPEGDETTYTMADFWVLENEPGFELAFSFPAPGAWHMKLVATGPGGDSEEEEATVQVL